MRYRLEVRLTSADVGSRVVIRWRRPGPAGVGTAARGNSGTGEEVADVLGILEAAGETSFTVRRASGERVVIPRDRALAGKTIPPARPRRQSAGGPG